jgi:hypothetical protein
LTSATRESSVKNVGFFLRSSTSFTSFSCPKARSFTYLIAKQPAGVSGRIMRDVEFIYTILIYLFSEGSKKACNLKNRKVRRYFSGRFLKKIREKFP